MKIKNLRKNKVLVKYLKSKVVKVKILNKIIAQ